MTKKLDLGVRWIQNPACILFIELIQRASRTRDLINHITDIGLRFWAGGAEPGPGLALGSLRCYTQQRVSTLQVSFSTHGSWNVQGARQDAANSVHSSRS